MKELEMLYEGKAKKVFATENPDMVIVDYKDDATAFNGLKKGTIVGKGVVNNKMTNFLFQKLEEKGIHTHFVEELDDRKTLVKKVDIVPLEVIIRNKVAGSFAKRMGLEEGTELLTLGNKSNIVLPDTLGLNKDNSNIVDFLSLPPTGDISYQGTVTVNPQGDEDNVIYSDGEIDLDAYVRIPFALSAEGLNYKDTLNDIDIDPKYADKIKEGVITITAVNGLPLNLRIPTLVLLGENGEKLESLTAVKGRDIIQAANGKESVLEFNLTQAQAKKLGQTENILLEVKASTTNNQEVVVAADAKLSFDLKLVAKAVITDLDDF